MLKPVRYLFTTVLIKLHSQLFRAGTDHWSQQTNGWAKGVLLLRCTYQSLNCICWNVSLMILKIQGGFITWRLLNISHLRAIFMSLFQIWGQRSKLVGEGCKRSWVQLQVCLGQNMAVSKCAILNNYCFLCSGCIANIAFALLLIGELVIWIKVRMSLLWCISLY